MQIALAESQMYDFEKVNKTTECPETPDSFFFNHLSKGKKEK